MFELEIDAEHPIYMSIYNCVSLLTPLSCRLLRRFFSRALPSLNQYPGAPIHVRPTREVGVDCIEI